MPRLIAGIDEVGRGCIAGPVIAAIVIFPEGDNPLEGLADSKKLSAKRREALVPLIETHATAWAIGRAEVGEIERINILNATFLAMHRAYDALSIKPDWIQVDGNHYPNLPGPGEAIIGGDGSIPAISAASILAKVFRDREMTVLDELYPGYGFKVHKGYPTPPHQTALQQLGPCPIHRRSFAPVRRQLSLFPDAER